MEQLNIEKPGDNLSAVNKAIVFKYISNLIIEQAIKDYIRGLDGGYQFLINDCETFFTSPGFEFISDLDGRYIIRQVRKNYKKLNCVGKKD